MMKTKFKIFGIICFIVFLTFYLLPKKRSEKDLFLINVEALANPETGNVICIGSGSLDCVETGTKVYTIIYK